jgi:UDP-N-acetylglucosamine--N-acetylmuramyl-(pentapeptide) pyrophosphoryl-undecaprenol N-acetylglucosamine transferase
VEEEGKALRIVLAGGGTGGHLYPALAVAEELRRRHPQAQVTFIGARRGLETRLVPAAGFRLRTLPLWGLKGARLPAKAAAAAAAGWAVLRCAWWMVGERPRLVVGVGGYASGPAVLAARSIGVKTMVLEQNHYPGATNRWLAPRVDAVCLPSEAALAHVRGRTFVTGNPVRREFFEIGAPPDGAVLSLLVFGGSRGARSINLAVAGALPALAGMESPPHVVHQTGRDDLARLRAAYAAYPAGRYELSDYFDDMPRRIEQADLVVCRSGASTVAELCAAGRPAILVPYPHAADDHQRHNAETLVRAGAAMLMADRELDGRSLAEAIAALAADLPRRRSMARAARALARPDAAARIADVADALLGGEPEGRTHVP